MVPSPIYTFIVNNIDYQSIYSQPLPSTIDNVINNLNSQAVYVPFINRPLKNGDVFTLYGKRAQIVHEMFIGKSPKVIELLSKTDRIPTLITRSLEFDRSTLPIKSAVSSVYDAIVSNYSGKDSSFLLSALDSEGERIDAFLKVDSEPDPSSPASSFLVSVSNNSSVNISIMSSQKFYFTFSELTFN